MRGFDYTVQERTTILHQDFPVGTTDDKPPAHLTRDGLFHDGVGFNKSPGADATGRVTLLQRFDLFTRDGQPGPRVSTVLRHETIVKNGEVTNGVFVVTP